MKCRYCDHLGVHFKEVRYTPDEARFLKLKDTQYITVCGYHTVIVNKVFDYVVELPFEVWDALRTVDMCHES